MAIETNAQVNPNVRPCSAVREGCSFYLCSGISFDNKPRGGISKKLVKQYYTALVCAFKGECACIGVAAANELVWTAGEDIPSIKFTAES